MFLVVCTQKSRSSSAISVLFIIIAAFFVKDELVRRNELGEMQSISELHRITLHFPEDIPTMRIYQSIPDCLLMAPGEE